MKRFRIAIPVLALFAVGCGDESTPSPDAAPMDSDTSPDVGAPDADTSDAETSDAGARDTSPELDTSPPDSSIPSSFCDAKIAEHGLPVLFEDDFEYTWDGTAGGAPPSWDDGRSDANVSIVESPLMGSRALLGRQPIGTGGSGTYHFEKDLGRDVSEAVFCFALGFEPEYPPNGTSEKILHFNLYSPTSYYLFQYHNNMDAVVMDIWPDPADDSSGGLYPALPPNRTERHSNGRLWVSPQPAGGTRAEYVIYMHQPTGTWQWWRDGMQMADHSDREFDVVNHITFSDTWGGGGSKPNADGRFLDDVRIAGE